MNTLVYRRLYLRIFNGHFLSWLRLISRNFWCRFWIWPPFWPQRSHFEAPRLLLFTTGMEEKVARLLKSNLRREKKNNFCLQWRNDRKRRFHEKIGNLWSLTELSVTSKWTSCLQNSPRLIIYPYCLLNSQISPNIFNFLKQEALKTKGFIWWKPPNEFFDQNEDVLALVCAASKVKMETKFRKFGKFYVK